MPPLHLVFFFFYEKSRLEKKKLRGFLTEVELERQLKARQTK